MQSLCFYPSPHLIPAHFPRGNFIFRCFTVRARVERALEDSQLNNLFFSPPWRFSFPPGLKHNDTFDRRQNTFHFLKLFFFPFERETTSIVKLSGKKKAQIKSHLTTTLASNMGTHNGLFAERSAKICLKAHQNGFPHLITHMFTNYFLPT